MANSRPRFADEYEERKAPAAVWVTRSVIVGLIVGVAGAGHILFGWQFF